MDNTLKRYNAWLRDAFHRLVGHTRRTQAGSSQTTSSYFPTLEQLPDRRHCALVASQNLEEAMANAIETSGTLLAPPLGHARVTDAGPHGPVGQVIHPSLIRPPSPAVDLENDSHGHTDRIVQFLVSEGSFAEQTQETFDRNYQHWLARVLVIPLPGGLGGQKMLWNPPGGCIDPPKLLKADIKCSSTCVPNNIYGSSGITTFRAGGEMFNSHIASVADLRRSRRISFANINAVVKKKQHDDR